MRIGVDELVQYVYTTLPGIDASTRIRTFCIRPVFRRHMFDTTSISRPVRLRLYSLPVRYTPNPPISNLYPLYLFNHLTNYKNGYGHDSRQLE